MLKRIFISISAMFFLNASSIAQTIDPNDFEAVKNAIKIKRDDFAKKISYEGPSSTKDDRDSVFIRSWKYDKDNITKYQIYIADYYLGEWRFYNSAFDSNGNKLDVVVIARDVGSCSRYSGCSHIEHIGINISKEYLEKNKDSGIHFKLNGKAGDEIFLLPSAYVQATLEVMK